MVDLTIQRNSDPIKILFGRFTFQISRFQLGPSTRLRSNFFDKFRGDESATKRFKFRYFPVTWSNVITITQVLITGPTIVRRRRVCPGVFNLFRWFKGRLFIRFRMDIFPIIRWKRTIALSIFRLVITDPNIGIATNLTHSIVTRDRRGFKDHRCFIHFRFVVEYVEISNESCTRIAGIICFRYGLRIANPTSHARRRTTLYFLYQLSRSRFRRQVYVRNNATTRLNISCFLSRLWLLTTRLDFFNPITTRLNWRVLKIKRVGRYKDVTPRNSKFLLIILSFTPYLSSIFFQVDSMIRDCLCQVLIIFRISGYLYSSYRNLLLKECVTRGHA